MAAEGREMLGAILGDIAGSRLEFADNRKKPEVLFTEDAFATDDTLMTVASFKASFSKDAGGTSLEELFLRETIQAVLLHPDAGWGLRFLSWIRGIVEENGIALSNLHEKSGIHYRPNGSAGNGSAMRVSPIPYLSSSMEECKALTRRITGVTHDHPDSYRAAECVATSIYLALEGKGREGIRKNILSYYPEVEGMTYEALNREYRYTELARDTVPPGDGLLPREQGLRGRPLDGRLHRRGRGHPGGNNGRPRGSFLRVDGRRSEKDVALAHPLARPEAKIRR